MFAAIVIAGSLALGLFVARAVSDALASLSR